MTRAVALLVVSLVPSLAVAGVAVPTPVTVSFNGDGSGSATGDMVTARFSDNDVELIGCGIRYFDDGAGGTVQFGFCQATDSDSVQGFCNTNRPDLLDAMKATGDFSFVTFSWDANGECRHIGFSTQSFYIPEFKDKKPKK